MIFRFLLRAYRYRLLEIILFSFLGLGGALWVDPLLPLQQPILICQFGAALFLFYSHAFFYNDWADRRTKDFAVSTLLWAGVTLVSSFWLFWVLSPGTFFWMLLLLIVSTAYSSPGVSLKAHVVLSSLLHLLGGLVQFLAAVSLFGFVDGEAIAIGLYAGLLLAGGHMAQEVEHCVEDRRMGVRTHAVRFGSKVTLRISLAIFWFASIYLGVLSLVGTVPWVVVIGALLSVAVQSAVFLAQGEGSPSLHRYRMLYRGMYASVGVVWYYLLCVS